MAFGLAFEERPRGVRTAALVKTQQHVIVAVKDRMRRGDVIKDAPLQKPSRCGHCLIAGPVYHSTNAPSGDQRIRAGLQRQ
jgi:hypothetical protein